MQNQAMALRESHANFTNKGTKKDLTEIHQFVKQIPVRRIKFEDLCVYLAIAAHLYLLLVLDVSFQLYDVSFLDTL